MTGRWNYFVHKREEQEKNPARVGLMWNKGQRECLRHYTHTRRRPTSEPRGKEKCLRIPGGFCEMSAANLFPLSQMERYSIYVSPIL